MDYLNTRKESRHEIVLFIGYGLIAIAIALTTLVLIYQAYGFGLAEKGTVIQNGLTFFSSQPNPATITLNGKVYKNKTNTRINLPEDIYKVQISRDGYKPWQRTIQVDGGSVQSFDYPFLIPNKFETTELASFAKAPVIASQSLDKRWLAVMQTAETPSFDIYDLKTPAKVPVTIALPDAVVTKAVTTQTWTALEWADSDSHVLLQHDVDGKIEYILLNRTNPEQSVNLSNTLTGSYNTITLLDRKFDSYYLHNLQTKVLQKASLSSPAAQAYAQGVINYKSYSDDTVLYATDLNAPKDKVQIKLRSGNSTYVLRTVPGGSVYPLDLTKYDGDLYVVLGASADDKLVVYKDPIGNIVAKKSLAPSQVLHVIKPNHVSFSSSAQFIMAQNGNQFAVYDVENDKGYKYITKQPLDMPTSKAIWMDGNRLSYVSKGAIFIFDYDYTNQHTLATTSSSFKPIFAPDYTFVYGLPAAANGATSLNQTSLLSSADR